MKTTEFNRLVEAVKEASAIAKGDEPKDVHEFFGGASPEWNAQKKILNEFQRFIRVRNKVKPVSRTEDQRAIYFPKTDKMSWSRFVSEFRVWFSNNSAPEGYKRPAMDGPHHGIMGWKKFDVECWIDETSTTVDDGKIDVYALEINAMPRD